MKAFFAEVFGTFWLVLGGCGAAVLAADFGTGGNGSSLGLGFVGVSLAFGLTVVTGAYAVGHISGGHFNPAVTLGLVAGGRFSAAKAPFYIIAQVIGGIIGAFTIYTIASGQADWSIGAGAGTFATNGYGEAGSPGGFSMNAAFVTEVVMTAVFLVIIMGATAKRAAPAMGGLAIGLGLTLIHLISIPVTNTSVNPARSTAQATIAAVFGDGATLPTEQLWLFWVAPIIGAIVGALIYRGLIDSNKDVETPDEPAQRARDVAEDRLDQGRATANRVLGRERNESAS